MSWTERNKGALVVSYWALVVFCVLALIACCVAIAYSKSKHKPPVKYVIDQKVAAQHRKLFAPITTEPEISFRYLWIVPSIDELGKPERRLPWQKKERPCGPRR